MYRRTGFSALTLLAACGVGVLLGTAMNERRPRVALAMAPAPAPAQAPDDGKLRIIVFGAHPDDAEYRGAGVAMKWAKMGHHVKLASASQPKWWTSTTGKLCPHSRTGVSSRG